jgi:hypothetical protein
MNLVIQARLPTFNDEKPGKESAMKIEVPERNYEGYRIRLMQEADAPAVVALYRAVYGDHFPIKEMYNPQVIVQQQEAGLFYRVLAEGAGGKVVAHHAMYRLAENYRGLYEGGQGMVYPEYRGKGFSNVLQDYIVKELAAAVGVEEFWGESVTNHVMMQKAALYAGVKESGIELEVMPAESYLAEKSAPGRVGVVVCNMVVKERPHTVFLPDHYADWLKRIYANGKRQRTYEASTLPLPEGGQTRYVDTHIPSANLLRLSIFDAGKDAEIVIADVVKKHVAAGAVVLQALLPLDKPWSGALTQLLNRQGFFFAAMVARWFDADALMLQKLLRPTDYDQMKIHTDFAKDMLAFIIQDRKRVEA